MDTTVTLGQVPDNVLKQVYAELQRLKAVSEELSKSAKEMAGRRQPPTKGPRQGQNGRKKRQRE